MLLDTIEKSANRYFETMERFDSNQSFGDCSPWIFNFYKGKVIGATIIAHPPHEDDKEQAFQHILNLLTFDKFDMVTINMDTWMMKTPQDDPDFDTRPSEALDREEAIVTLGATADEIEQSMMIYGRNDDGSIYEKEHIVGGTFDGWMQQAVKQAMNFQINMETLVYMAMESTDIFDDVKETPMSEIIRNLKQEWINLLTSNDCMVAFSEVTSSFNDLDGYDIVDFSEEE